MKSKNIFLNVNIISTEKKIFIGYADFIIIPCIMGDIGVYPKHINFISLIKFGIIKIKIYKENLNKFFFVTDGIVEINSNYVNILVNTVAKKC